MKCLTAKQMREVDRKIVEEIGMPSLVLMEQVAMNCYHQLLSIIDRSQKIQVVCGNGNNGGDGLAIARLLHLNHYSVSIVFVGDETALTSDCAQNMKIAKAFGIPFQELNECDIIIDAILGTGCSRKVEGKLANVIEKINKCHAKVIAIDVPSGLSSDTGQILGCAVQADITFTLGTVKCGCVVYPGKEYCGQLEVVSVSSLQHEIDLIPSFYHLIDHQTMKAWLPQRKSHSHKGTYGKVLCVGGSLTMSGSITMSALASYRSGCGIVTVAIPSCIQSTVASSLLEAMTLPLADEQGVMSLSCCKQLADVADQYTCILYGCGVARNPQQIEILKTLIKSNLPLIIDADGLVALKSILPFIKSRKHIIITPHLAEFARLFDYELEEVINHRYDCLREVQIQYPELIIVLKSETTLIHSQDCCFINTFGNSGLAVGGSGDTLAGIIAGMFAQNQSCFEASVLGVYLHAICADEVAKKRGEYSLMPSDLIDELPSILKSMSESN